MFAQKRIPTFKATSLRIINDSLLKRKFSSYTTIHLLTSELENYVLGKSSFSFELELTNELHFTLELEPSSIVAPDYKLSLLTPEGIKTLNTNPDFLFKGRVKGTNQQVRLAIKDGYLNGFIETGSSEYFIEPLKPYAKSSEKDEFVFYKATDVIGDGLSCGVKDDRTSNLRQERVTGTNSTEDMVCKKVTFTSLTDYSIYQKFNGIVTDIETAIFTNLNNAESAYKALNFDMNNASDVGTDVLKFEVERIVISTCPQCVFTSSSNNVGEIQKELVRWISDNDMSDSGRIYQVYTTRELYAGSAKPVVGYQQGPEQLIRYHTDDAATLRLIVAHETGHNLGCDHDNAKKAGVSRFIMYSSAGPSNTTFSTLADFGGMDYSSQLVIKQALTSSMYSHLFSECQFSTCPEVKDVKILDVTDNEIKIGWSGSGNFLTKYKISDSLSFPAGNIQLVSTNNLLLQNLKPCTIYSFHVQRVCSDNNYGPVTVLEISASPISVHPRPVNFRNQLYDLQLDVDCKNCSASSYIIKDDRTAYQFAIHNGSNQIIIKDLFADGARHKVDIQKDTLKNSCKTIVYYKAPYYRSDSKDLLSANFDDCVLPDGWEDSVISNSPGDNPYFLVAKNNFYDSRAPNGTIDSSCMIYYYNFLYFKGSLALTSSAVDLTGYSNIVLHYDYNFVIYNYPNIIRPGSVQIQAFDGNQWKTLENFSTDQIINFSAKPKIWDSLPPRKFIGLDSLKNRNFRIRFIIDDGQTTTAATSYVFAALDNIRVDGYPMDKKENNESIVFPNPVKDELFVRFTNTVTRNINYRLVDITGRVLQKGKVNNYRISVGARSSGVYLITFYDDNRLIATKKITKL